MGARPGVLALPAIPFVNLGQLPTLHFSFTVESSGRACGRISDWESLTHRCMESSRGMRNAAWQHLIETRLS